MRMRLPPSPEPGWRRRSPCPWPSDERLPIRSELNAAPLNRRAAMTSPPRNKLLPSFALGFDSPFHEPPPESSMRIPTAYESCAIAASEGTFPEPLPIAVSPTVRCALIVFLAPLSLEVLTSITVDPRREPRPNTLAAMSASVRPRRMRCRPSAETWGEFRVPIRGDDGVANVPGSARRNCERRRSPTDESLSSEPAIKDLRSGIVGSRMDGSRVSSPLDGITSRALVDGGSIAPEGPDVDGVRRSQSSLADGRSGTAKRRLDRSDGPRDTPELCPLNDEHRCGGRAPLSLGPSSPEKVPQEITAALCTSSRPRVDGPSPCSRPLTDPTAGCDIRRPRLPPLGRAAAGVGCGVSCSASGSLVDGCTKPRRTSHFPCQKSANLSAFAVSSRARWTTFSGSTDVGPRAGVDDRLVPGGSTSAHCARTARAAPLASTVEVSPATMPEELPLAEPPRLRHRRGGGGGAGGGWRPGGTGKSDNGAGSAEDRSACACALASPSESYRSSTLLCLRRKKRTVGGFLSTRDAISTGAPPPATEGAHARSFPPDVSSSALGPSEPLSRVHERRRPLAFSATAEKLSAWQQRK